MPRDRLTAERADAASGAVHPERDRSVRLLRVVSEASLLRHGLAQKRNIQTDLQHACVEPNAVPKTPHRGAAKSSLNARAGRRLQSVYVVALLRRNVTLVWSMRAAANPCLSTLRTARTMSTKRFCSKWNSTHNTSTPS